MNVPKALGPELEEFFIRLRRTKDSLLLLDFDGTLAPFVVERSRAEMYPGVSRAIDAIQDYGRTRVVVVSGRAIDDLLPLLALNTIPEVWGSHGLERRLPDGTRVAFGLDPAVVARIDSIAAVLRQTGLDAYWERKPYGIAIHWRGVPLDEATAIEGRARALLITLAKGSPLEVLEFSAGVELRPRAWNKGDAVRDLLLDVGRQVPVAYLGDDTTDEDAFSVVNAAGGLSVLVRSESVESHARVRISPPQQLLAFLKTWRETLDQ